MFPEPPCVPLVYKPESSILSDRGSRHSACGKKQNGAQREYAEDARQVKDIIINGLKLENGEDEKSWRGEGVPEPVREPIRKKHIDVPGMKAVPAGTVSRIRSR